MCTYREKTTKLNLKMMEIVNQLENAMHCQPEAHAKGKELKQVACGKGRIFSSQTMLLVPYQKLLGT